MFLVAAFHDSIANLNLGETKISPKIPSLICSENSGNVCRGAGTCDVDLQRCVCADGATGAFCELLDTDNFASLTFAGREFFDTSHWNIHQGNRTISVNTTA